MMATAPRSLPLPVWVSGVTSFEPETESDRQERVSKIASAIADSGASLTAADDVIRALYAAGFSCADFIDVLDEAISAADLIGRNGPCA